MPAKKFRFALQALLDHRLRLEDEAKQDWLNAKIILQQFEAAHRAKGSDVLSARNSRGAWQMISGEDLMIRQLLFEQELRALEEARQRMEEQRKVVNEKQEILIAKSRDRKAMEILYDKQKEEFRREQNKIEQKFLDELGTSLTSRKRIEQNKSSPPSE